MTVSMRDRRDFLQAALAGATALALPPAASAGIFSRSSKAAQIEATSLSDTVTLYTGAGANVVTLSGPDGLLMIDGGLAEHSPALLKAISEHSGKKKIQVLFNTHWHPEQTGSNLTLGKAGTKIIAHENTRLWLTTEVHVDWQNKTYKPLPKQALPTETFYTNGSLKFGDETVEYGHLFQAHTDGDIYVFFREQNILVAGGVVTVGSYPISDYCTGGWIGGMVRATQTLLDLTNANTRIVPADGPAQGRDHLQAQHDMLSTLRTRYVEMMRKGMGRDDMIAAGATKEFDAKWGDPTVFVSNIYPGLWAHVRELGGIV